MTIGDLGKVVTGKTPSTKNDILWNGSIPFITPKDIQGLKHIVRTERTVTQVGANTVKGSIIPPNAICVSCIGNIGYAGMTTQWSITNQQINSIIVNKENDANFVYYLVRGLWKFFKNYEGQSTTLSILNKSQFSKIEVEIPSLEKQKKIAAILSSIDAKIEVNQKINDNLEEQSKVIFDKLFPNISNGSYTVGDYITPKRGKNLLSKNAVQGNVPVVAGGLVPSVYHNTSNTKAPVLAISASGANAGYVSLWNIPIWASDSSYIDSSMTNNVYFWYVLLKKRQKEIFDAQTGSAQPHIYPQHIAGMPIKELEVAKIQEFNAMVTPIFEKIGKNLKENTQLETLRDILLPKLMSGEIDISAVQF